MSSFQFLFVLLTATLFGCVLCHPERPSLIDPGKARELFHLAEGNVTNPNGLMDAAEVAEIFSLFDLDGDNQVERGEFIQEWTDKGLGSLVSANYLFSRADTDQDGAITSSPDMGRVFHYFDLNGDGDVSEMEFVVVWSSLSH